ncbi:hypothetical protein ACD661_15105 [Legionella lytica]|uniref:Substrate of the Dot/Icm secretion system n=1 Tax=Legionella lytica TaxID=96232 RepID=A0ABW8DB10_9GAMM
MQTPSTTITTTDSSTTTEHNPYQTPVKKNPSGTHTKASDLFFMQDPRVNQNIKPQALEPKTEEEFLDRIFSLENLNKEKNLSYNNRNYLIESKSKLRRQRRFVAFDEKIDVTYPFLRYTTDKLKELLIDANDVHKPLSFNVKRIKHQREIPPQITTSDGSRTPPPDNLQAEMGDIVPGLTVPSTSQTNSQMREGKILQSPRKMVRRQLFPRNPTTDTPQSGLAPNELIPVPAPIFECTSVKRNFSYLLNTMEASSTLSSTTEKDSPSPFDGEAIVRFRFVIGSSIEGKTLFSIGFDETKMSHGQLAAKTEDAEVSCNAAGIICFEKCDEKWLIKTVSNKTGHFKCGSESFLTTIGMLFTDFSSYLSEEITLINESLENPKEKKSFTFKVNSLKKRYDDYAISVPPAIHVDIPNAEHTATTEDNALLFFSTPKKARRDVSSHPTRDSELAQLGTDYTPTGDQPNYKFP